MAANLTAPAVFDPKLEHLMTYYFLALGDQYDIRQAFIQNDIKLFEAFSNSCTLKILLQSR